MNNYFVAALLWALVPSFAQAALPVRFDLRSVGGKNFVSNVKKQTGGTCWTHGVMAALESNLMVTGNWVSSGEWGEPDLAEYHLDWWNGFNHNFNADTPTLSSGLDVHSGGDYRVAAAYLSRGSGAVPEEQGQAYPVPPLKTSAEFHYFIPRDIEWLSAGANLETIDDMKTSLMTNGALGTALAWSSDYYSADLNSFYEKPSASDLPNHAVAIVGWDDTRATQAPLPGAWLVKNSWGSNWADHGYFWISYYDKTAGQHPEMGAVAFEGVHRYRYQHAYYHDYHGWRDTKDVKEAFNAFAAEGSGTKTEHIRAVSFYTTTPNTRFDVRSYGHFEGGILTQELARESGEATHLGFHTVDLETPLSLHTNDKFYVYLRVSQGGQAFDRTSEVPVLLGARYRAVVTSTAAVNESFYFGDHGWSDLYNENHSANFCIKAYSTED